jgi:hypothetical protein
VRVDVLHALAVHCAGSPCSRHQDTSFSKGLDPVEDGKTRKVEPPGQAGGTVAVLENLVDEPHLPLPI